MDGVAHVADLLQVVAHDAAPHHAVPGAVTSSIRRGPPRSVRSVRLSETVRTANPKRVGAWARCSSTDTEREISTASLAGER
jgi:hypothetical protein